MIRCGSSLCSLKTVQSTFSEAQEYTYTAGQTTSVLINDLTQALRVGGAHALPLSATVDLSGIAVSGVDTDNIVQTVQLQVMQGATVVAETPIDAAPVGTMDNSYYLPLSVTLVAMLLPGMYTLRARVTVTRGADTAVASLQAVLSSTLG